LVFDRWVEATGKTSRTKLDGKRRGLIERALKLYDLEEVLAAVTNWEHSPWHTGKNPQGKTYNDLGLLLRDADHIEKFRDMTPGPGSQPASWGTLKDMMGDQE
jgi:hypothetical protein